MIPRNIHPAIIIKPDTRASSEEEFWVTTEYCDTPIKSERAGPDLETFSLPKNGLMLAIGEEVTTKTELVKQLQKLTKAVEDASLTYLTYMFRQIESRREQRITILEQQYEKE